MISSNEAWAAISSRRFIPTVETVRLENAMGRILGNDIFADMDQPPFHRVAMDGVAIHSSLLKETTSFKILDCISAGSVAPDLPSGPVCFEIMTGAMLPAGADMVIRYEDLSIKDGIASLTISPENLKANFHPRGSDYPKGHKVLSQGTKIKSTTIALLASVGQSQVPVLTLPKISIISTGDELVDIDETPSPSQIRWSNGICLKQELFSWGQTEVTLIKLKDNEEKLQQVITKELEKSDLLLLTGGVSAGKFDFVPGILKKCSVNEVFHKISQRPGKPLWFGETDSNKLVFGLPGNPVSCLVNLRKFVIPLIELSISGRAPVVPRASLTAEVSFNKNMTYYCAVKVHQEGTELMATPIAGNGSGDFFQLQDSDGFMELRSSEGPFKKGHVSEVYLWGH